MCIALHESTFLIEKNEDQIMYADISELMHAENRLSRALNWKIFAEDMLSRVDTAAGFVVS